MNRYEYNGPVLIFGKCVQSNYRAETMANTERKALSNFAYQWKKANNRIASVKVDLPGKVRMM